MNKKGLIVLKSLISNSLADNIGCVVSSEDRNVKKDYYDEIKDVCKNEKLIFLNRKEYNGSSNFFKIAVGWRWLVKDFSNLIVFHDSLLPKYRGFAPLVNALINGETKIGVTSLFASKEYDRGNIIGQKEIEITYPKKISDIIDEISVLYQEMVVEVVKNIRNNIPLDSYKQNEEQATYSLWRDENDYYIDWNWGSKRIKRFVDAVGYPYLGAKSKLNNGSIVTILEVELVHDVIIMNRGIGKIIFINENKPVVVCGEGLIKIKQLEDFFGEKTKISNFRSKFF